MDHKGWRSRGYLPHCDERGLVQHIIFGLADAIVQDVPASIVDPIKRAEWADRALDAGDGRRLLANREHAEEVQRCLLHDDGEHYALAAWCIMPTHIHVVVEPFDGRALDGIVQTWKSVTSHNINKRERRRGSLWCREYFDRFMRSEEQFAWTVEYVERNPVTASLVGRPEDWPFSSASWRRRS
ncbi:MAG: transposase [Pseudomonadota bacterium]